MKISIITPCFNAEKYLSSMIDSVLQQSYEHFELIIVNDGSTDSSANIVTEYAKNDCRIILLNQKNSGKPSIARNNGIKISTGDVLAFLDADDTMMPTKLQKVVTAFESNPGHELVVHDYCHIDSFGEIHSNGVIEQKWQSEKMDSLFTQKGCYYHSSADLYNYFLSQWIFLHVNTIAIKKKNIASADLLFDETLLFAEDIAKWCELTLERPIVLIKECLATYRDTPNSLMTNQLKADLAALSFFEKHYNAPLKDIEVETKNIVHLKILKEIQDALFISSHKGLIGISTSLSIKLLNQQPNFLNLYKAIKYTALVIAKSIKN